MSEILNLQATTPAAPGGARNGVWQKAGTSAGTDPTSGQPYFDTSVYITDMVGDTGSGGADGLAPAPPAGSAAAGKFLKADGTWAVPAGDPNTLIGVLGIVIDGGGSTPATGLKGFLTVPYGCTIDSWTIIADQSGSASVDVWFLAGSAPPTAPSIPTSSNKISASAPIALSSAQSAAGGSSAISTWTAALSQWGTLAFNLTAATTLTRIAIQIQVTKS